MQRSQWLDDWYISWSPRNENQNAEGTWAEWVEFANAILAVDEREAEHERLRAAVVDAARLYIEPETERDYSLLVARKARLCMAVDALVAFEQEGA